MIYKTEKTSFSIENLEKAFILLESISIDNLNDLEKAGIVTIFELCYELSWRLLRKALYYKGINSSSPQTVIRKSADAGLINNLDGWLRFLEANNKAEPIYALQAIEEIILNIIPEFQREIFMVIQVLKDALEMT